MAWMHVEDKAVTTRKPHLCILCGVPIGAGTKAVKRFGYSEDGPESHYMHAACEELTHDWEIDDWECFSTGDGDWPEVPATEKKGGV